MFEFVPDDLCGGGEGEGGGEVEVGPRVRSRLAVEVL